MNRRNGHNSNDISTFKNAQETTNPPASFSIDGHRFVVYAPGNRVPPDAGSAAGMMFIDGRPWTIVEQTVSRAGSLRDPMLVLTPRELQIATLIAHGKCTKRVAFELRISEWTVHTHLRRMYAKLGVAGRAELVFRCAKELGT